MIILLGLMVLMGCSDTMTSEYDDRPLAVLLSKADSLYSGGQKKSSSKYYEAITLNYPGDKKAKYAHKRLMSIYKSTGDKAGFIDAAEHFIMMYPDDVGSDEIYWMRAEHYYQQYESNFRKYLMLNYADHEADLLNKSESDFIYIVNNYKKSKYYSKSKERIKAIQSFYARHELSVAEYYEGKKNIKAAIKRAKRLLKLYPNAPKDVQEKARNITKLT